MRRIEIPRYRLEVRTDSIELPPELSLSLVKAVAAFGPLTPRSLNFCGVCGEVIRPASISEIMDQCADKFENW